VNIKPYGFKDYAKVLALVLVIGSINLAITRYLFPELSYRDLLFKDQVVFSEFKKISRAIHKEMP
jgi:hypothetical protein